MTTTTATASGRPGRWAEADLEAFLDGALDAAAAAELGAALREDPALRAQLAAISRADALMAEALELPTGALGPARGASRRRWAIGAGGLWAAAASVAVAVGVWGVLLWRGGAVEKGTAPRVVREDVLAEERAQPAAYEAVPVVLTVKLPARPAGNHSGGGAEAAAVVTRLTHEAPADSRLTRAIAAGDVARAVGLIDGAGPAAQESAYRQIGELMRSASVAERVLDSMEPAQQLAACRLWAEDPKLRTVVFPRLAALAGDGELGAELAAVVREMSGRDELRPWVRSYGLAAALEGRAGTPRG